MILCNPLVITEEGLARSTIRHYYGKRLFDKEFLQKLIHFEIDLKRTVMSLWGYLKDAKIFIKLKSDYPGLVKESMPVMFINSLNSFGKPIRIIISTDDIIADNFQDELKKNNVQSADLKRKNIVIHIIKGADHTFTDPMARKELFAITLKAVNEIRM